MTSKLFKWILSASFCLSSSVAFAAEVHGVLQVVKGDVTIKSAKDGSVSKAKVGGKIFPKDTIITGKEARAKIVMVDNNVINVSPETNLEIKNYEYAPEQGKKDVLLNVLYGKVRSKVEQKYEGSKNSQFQIKTPTAVAGVRGTDFIAGFAPSTNASSIVTFEGKVEFGQPGPNGTILNPVQVTPGQQTEMKGNQPPPPPRPVPPEQLAKMDMESKAEAPASNSGSSENRGQDKDKKEESKKEEAQKEEGKKEEAKKDEAKKEESKKEDAKKDNSQKQGQAEPAKEEKKQAKEGDTQPKEQAKGEGQKSDSKGSEAGGNKAEGSGNKNEPANAKNEGQTKSGPSSNSGSSSSSAGGGPKGPAVGAVGPGGGSNGGSPGAGPAAGAAPAPGSGGMPTPNMGGMDRTPTSIGGGGSMMMPSDFAGAPTANVLPSLGNALPVIPITTAPIAPVTTPICDFCNRVIESGNNSLIIRINH